MVWGGVSLHHKTYIVFKNGNLTAAPFEHEVLDKEVFPLLKNLRGMQLLRDTTTTYLKANNVNVVDFPSPPPPPPQKKKKSPDLNIISLNNILFKYKVQALQTGKHVYIVAIHLKGIQK